MAKKYKSKNLIGFIPEATLDFHEYGVIDHFEIQKILEEFIEDSYISQQKFILVVTGKGKVVRPLVKKLLRENKYVESFKEASYFNGQNGAVEVTLI